MISFKTTGILADTIGPMFGIVLPGNFSAKALLKSSFKSLSHTTTGTPLESKNKKRIRTVFEQFDKDGNGHIDHSEFTDLCKRLGQDMTQEEIDSTLKQIDADHNGTIEFEEFYIWWTTDPAHSKDADGLNKLRTKLNGLTFAKLWRDLLGKKPTDSMKEEDPDDVSTADAPDAAANVRAKKDKKGPKVKMIDASGPAEQVSESTNGKKKKSKKDKEAASDAEGSSSSTSGDAEKTEAAEPDAVTPVVEKRANLEERALTMADEVKDLTALLNKKIGSVVTDLAAEIVFLKSQVRELTIENRNLKEELDAIKKPQEVEANKAKKGQENLLKKSLNAILGNSSKGNKTVVAPDATQPADTKDKVDEKNDVELEEKPKEKSLKQAKKAPTNADNSESTSDDSSESTRQEPAEKKAKQAPKKTAAAKKGKKATVEEVAETPVKKSKKDKTAEAPAEEAPKEETPSKKEKKEKKTAVVEPEPAPKPAKEEKPSKKVESSSSSASESSEFEESVEDPKSKRKSERRQSEKRKSEKRQSEKRQSEKRKSEKRV